MQRLGQLVIDRSIWNLFCTSNRSKQIWPVTYRNSEMHELFTQQEIATLLEGGTVTKPNGHGVMMKYVDGAALAVLHGAFD